MTKLETDLDLVKRIPLKSVWVHRASGGKYQVLDHHEGADGYESGRSLELRIGYMQLDDGEIRNAGSRYSRSTTDFLKEFEMLPENSSTTEILKDANFNKIG